MSNNDLNQLKNDVAYLRKQEENKGKAGCIALLIYIVPILIIVGMFWFAS